MNNLNYILTCHISIAIRDAKLLSLASSIITSLILKKGRNQGRVTEALTYMTSPQHCSVGGDDRQHVDRVAKGNIKGGVKGTCVLLHIRGNVAFDDDDVAYDGDAPNTDENIIKCGTMEKVVCARNKGITFKDTISQTTSHVQLQDSQDILSQALNVPEHLGRVRGYGFRPSLRDCFPSQKHKRKDDDLTLKEQVAFIIRKKVKQLESKLHAKEVDGQPISADNVKYSCMLISYDILEVPKKSKGKDLEKANESNTNTKKQEQAKSTSGASSAIGASNLSHSKNTDLQSDSTTNNVKDSCMLISCDVSETDRGLSKEHKDLETLHELKGAMTRSRAKLLQEEMAKKIKDGLLIKDKEGENHKKLN
ncbi:hypothetical protein JHK82_055762 [Glycine max]|nr:hypothetical protein JHK82_055762 [Glycine max]